MLRAVLKKLLIPHAEHYSSHGFRRGAANELQSTGSLWTTVATLGDWRSLALNGRVDLTNEVLRDLSKLLIEDMAPDSEDEDDH